MIRQEEAMARRRKNKVTKVQLCADCCKRPVTLVFDDKKGIFKGNRLCTACKQSYKRQYFVW